MVTRRITTLLLFVSLSFFLAAGPRPVRAQSREESREILEQVLKLEDLIDFSRPSPGQTVRYPNRQLATMNYGSTSASWYWPNGKMMSIQAGSPNATWYWPNGKMMTVQIGSPNATWYWPDGQIMTLRGPGFSAQELSDTPRLAAKVLRLATRSSN